MGTSPPPFWRWYILFLTCMVTLGGYYSFDFPSSLHGPLYRHFSRESPDLTAKDFELYFSLLFSLYSLPNMVLPWIGGMLSDKYGNNRVMIVVASLVLLGNFIQSYACYNYNILLLMIGRFIFGLGAETLTVCTNTTISKWFSGHDLALSMGINLSSCKLGGVLTAWVSPVLAKKFGVDGSSLAVSILCLVSFLLTVVLIVQEPHYEAHLLVNEDTNEEDSKIEMQTSYQSIEMSPTVESGTVRSRYAQVQQDAVDEVADNDRSKSVEESKTPHQGLLEFSSSVWLVLIITFVMYGTFIPFSNISNAVILEAFYSSDAPPGSIEYQEDEIEAAKLQSIPYFLTVFINPAFGFTVDWIGFRPVLLIASSAVLVMAHSLIYTADAGPIVPLLSIGLSFSIFGSVVWPCIPLIVPEEHRGTAYGLMAAFQNTAQTIVPLALQQIYRDTSSYRYCELFLACFASLGIAVGLVLWYVDEHYNRAVLRKPERHGAMCWFASG